MLPFHGCGRGKQQENIDMSYWTHSCQPTLLKAKSKTAIVAEIETTKTSKEAYILGVAPTQ